MENKMKIIQSIGIFNSVFDFDQYNWKEEPERGLAHIQADYPIAVNKEYWENITSCGKEWFAGNVETIYDFGKVLFEVFTEDMMDHLHKALISYTKYSDNPIYKKALKELGW